MDDRLTKAVQKLTGFSLIELMVVVAIIGLLSAIGYGRIGRFMARGRQAEAKTTLAEVEKMNKAYIIHNGAGFLGGSGATFGDTVACTGDSKKLGLSDCESLRYDYQISGDNDGFIATAAIDSGDLIFGCDPQPAAGVVLINSTTGLHSEYGAGAAFTHAAYPAATDEEDGHFVTEKVGVVTGYDITQEDNCN